MICSKCGSENISVQMVQTSAISKTKDKGCLYSIGRGLLILFTFGLWLLFGRKRWKTKTRFKNKTVAICQDCGNKWVIRDSKTHLFLL